VQRLRPSEILCIAYFAYVAAIASFFIGAAWRAWAELAAVVTAAAVFSRADRRIRDWIPLAFTLAAYREMNWFTPALRDHHLENAWIRWDHSLLEQAGVRSAIESAGWLIPGYLELCYLLVYAVAPVSLVALILHHRRERADRFWLAYLAGTLGCYALFPYFPSDPPRVVFPDAGLPHVVTIFRKINLAIVGNYGIHSSVFPSAHVASAFSAAWGLLALLPEKRWIGWAMAVYAASVAVATVYGRYHYAADALAGLIMSALAAMVIVWERTRAARLKAAG
jgi:membrane-associated phospholipid phosphatase